jgi:hypothetical protein
MRLPYLPIVAEDVTAPLSPHSVHVTETADVRPAGDWSRETLVAAVDTADAREAVVVLDYARETLYLADADDLEYESAGLAGTRGEPALAVESPRVLAADGRSVDGDRESVTVGPEFDVLVPAFDLEELEELPPAVGRQSERPTGAGTGSPG